ncbi:MAG: hypothetical protein ABSC72_05135 [Methylovirgula sp.]|jgi:hypothetical protein
MKTFLKASLAAIVCVMTLGAYSSLFAADQTDGGEKGCICMELYQPVCAKLPTGEKKTFSNACFAKCAKATVIHDGPC